jgi:hypothetical protein
MAETETSPVPTALQEDQAASQTLNTLSFSSLIGGPLVAGVNASAQAAAATAEYIEKLAFKDSGKDGTYQLQTVSFNYTSTNGSGQTMAQTLNVPLISILPIPYLRVGSMDIEFKAKINSIATATNVNTFNTNDTADGHTGGLLNMFATATFDVSVADQNVNSRLAQQTSSYSLDVKVHAGVDELPGGMQRVLNIFDSLITPVPASAGTTTQTPVEPPAPKS